MIRKGFRYLRNHGLRKTAARLLFELSVILDRKIGDEKLSDEKITDGDDDFQGVHNETSMLALFKENINGFDHPRILELGSRTVTKDALRYMLDLHFPHEYVGLDIHEGSNVNVVGDAHELSSLFPKEHFDIIMSKAVFEHLAMPWKVILEINKVLKPGGLLFINTLHTFPLHEKPWDFWRFSEEAWTVLLNRWTGFEIIHKNMEFPCKVMPASEVPEWGINHEAYLLSNVLARKTGEYLAERLKWDIRIADILESTYPKYEH